MSNPQQVAAKVPSTQQAVSGINKAQDYLSDRAQDGGKGAERTVADINQALKDAKDLVVDKDLGNSIKKLATDAAAVGTQAQQNAPSASGLKAALPSGVDADTEAISREAHEAANQLRRISQLAVTSPAFRHFLWNYYTLARDTFGPQVDKALEQRLKEGRKDDLTIKGEQKINELKAQGQQKEGQAEATKRDAQNAAQDVSQRAKQGDAAGAVATARDKTQQLTQQAKSEFDRQFPKEKRQEIVQRWESLKSEIDSDPNLRAAIEDLKNTIVRLRRNVQPVIEQAQQKAQEVKEKAQEKSQEAKSKANEADTTGLQQVVADARDLIEKFSNGKSLQPLIDAVQGWSQAIQNDQELKGWVNNFYNFVVVTKNDTNKINDDQHLQRLNQLIEQGRSLTQGKHKRIAESLLDESRDYLTAIRNDKATNKLRNSLNNVIQDLFVDNTGKFVVKPDVYKQLKDAFAPSIGDLFTDLRIAHIEDHNETADFALDNIVIDASDIQPKQFDVTNIADISLGKEDTGIDFRFKISAKGFCPKIRNCYFRYEKHTFPKLSDFGSIDAELTGDGLSFNIDIEFAANAKDNEVDRTFRAKSVDVDLHGLKLDFHAANHELAYKIFKPLIIKAATKQIEKSIKEQLYSFVDQLDQAATDARYRAAEAIDQAAGGRIVRGVDNNVGQTARS